MNWVAIAIAGAAGLVVGFVAGAGYTAVLMHGDEETALRRWGNR